MALLKRIGIEPTPELIAAYRDLKDQVRAEGRGWLYYDDWG
jgi:hypothetical protein